jgi:hypothetical protein
MIDVSDPYLPFEVAFFETGGFAYEVALLDDHIFLADGYDGVYILRNPLVTSVQGETPDLSFHLFPNHPNPFNPSTTIRYRIAEPSVVSLRVLDITGRVVRTLREPGIAAAGLHQLTWNGTDRGGRAVASGVYFLNLTAGGQVLTERMTLVR